MIALPAHLFERLKANGEASQVEDLDHVPVVKFFDPSGGAVWLITELDLHDTDLLFGLCDLGLGFPELGIVSFAELQSGKGRLGIGLERDPFFQGRYPISVYAAVARDAGRVVEDMDALTRAARRLGAGANG